MRYKILFIIASLIVGCTFAQNSSESATEAYFASIKSNPDKLLVFLYAMPKGGDLHNHLGGASMAENMINYGKGDQFCIDQQTYAASVNRACQLEYKLDTLPQYTGLYNTVIDAWSMRNFQPGKESGRDHFFATFAKFGSIAGRHSGEILSEMVNRAGAQNELYLEIMTTADDNASGMLGKKIGWDKNLSALRAKLLAGGLKNSIADISKNLTRDEKIVTDSLYCGTGRSQPGCQVKLRYLYQVLREQPPAQVFAQLLAGFEAASKDPRVVGINMVQPEDGAISMRDYSLHMQMIEFLHAIYPTAHISLHAGELVPGLVPTEGLRFHIRQAVEIAHASRIGHGVDIIHETNYKELLEQMAKRHVMTEINLESNAAILNVTGNDHPLLLYMRYDVPVALSTDDEGVLRTNLTNQYEWAVRNYDFSYPTLKKLSRNSIFYSFLPGENLWSDYDYQHIKPACAQDSPGSITISPQCKTFLASSEKANLQWELEEKFVKFEQSFIQNK